MKSEGHSVYIPTPRELIQPDNIYVECESTTKRLEDYAAFLDLYRTDGSSRQLDGISWIYQSPAPLGHRPSLGRSVYPILEAFYQGVAGFADGTIAQEFATTEEVAQQNAREVMSVLSQNLSGIMHGFLGELKWGAVNTRQIRQLSSPETKIPIHELSAPLNNGRFAVEYVPSIHRLELAWYSHSRTELAKQEGHSYISKLRLDSGCSKPTIELDFQVLKTRWSYGEEEGEPVIIPSKKPESLYDKYLHENQHHLLIARYKTPDFRREFDKSMLRFLHADSLISFVDNQQSSAA